jgi:hypothetical protein
LPDYNEVMGLLTTPADVEFSVEGIILFLDDPLNPGNGRLVLGLPLALLGWCVPVSLLL